MPLSRLTGFVSKVLRSIFVKPIQRYNVYNRAQKYLGPDAKLFFPAPRAIGSSDGIKSLPYPHFEAKGSRGLAQKKHGLLGRILPDGQTQLLPTSKTKDHFVIDSSNKLEVTKTVVRVDPKTLSQPIQLLEEPDGTQTAPIEALGPVKNDRPLPKSRMLPMDDPRAIWECNKVPPGRMNLNSLQELMFNKLADEEYWTPKVVADHYNIKEDYADQLLSSIKQIRIVVSPRMAKLLDYVAREDKTYQATKDTVYIVDKSQRNDLDKKYDKMFLPDEELAPDVKELIDPPTDPENLQIITRPSARFEYLVKKPQPLRIAPINKHVQEERARMIESMPPRRLRGVTPVARAEKDTLSPNLPLNKIPSDSKLLNKQAGSAEASTRQTHSANAK